MVSFGFVLVWQGAKEQHMDWVTGRGARVVFAM